MRNSCDEIQADRTRDHFHPSVPSFQLSLAALSLDLGKLILKNAAKRRGSRANFLPPRDHPKLTVSTRIRMGDAIARIIPFLLILHLS